MLGNIGMPELLVIFLFVLIFFGAKKIPDMAKGLGQGMREFRNAMKDVEDTVKNHAGSDLFDEKGSTAPGGSIPRALPPDHSTETKKTV